MAKFSPNTWERYKLKTPLYQASEAELKAAVRKASKAANQRLVRLERGGFTKGLYAMTMKELGQSGRRRFKEYPAKMSIPELRTEYQRLRSFISAKTSTVSGRKGVDYMRYQTAVDRGFKGNMEEFYTAIEKFYNSTTESIYGSETIYEAIISGDTDDIEEIIRIANESKDDPGKVLLTLLRRKKNREAQKRYRARKKNAKK